jgi:hypothetical protein
LRKKLLQSVTIDKDVENAPLKDVLDFLSKEYGVQFVVDSKAFEAIGIAKVEEQTVQLVKMKDVRLSTVLRLLLGQLRGDQYAGTFMLRPDFIEVTTTYQQLAEAAGDDPAAVFGWGTAEEEPLMGPPAPGGDDGQRRYPASKSPLTPPELRRLTPVVQPDFENLSLADALRELAAEAGVDIVIDARALEKARVPVSLTLYNSLLDTSVTLLTDMADLDWVWIDKVIYVTTPENAKAKREKARILYEERSKALKRYAPPQKPSASPPG